MQKLSTRPHSRRCEHVEDDVGAAEDGEDLVEHGEGHQDQRRQCHAHHQERVPEPGGQQDPGVEWYQ